MFFLLLPYSFLVLEWSFFFLLSLFNISESFESPKWLKFLPSSELTSDGYENSCIDSFKVGLGILGFIISGILAGICALWNGANSNGFSQLASNFFLYASISGVLASIIVIVWKDAPTTTDDSSKPTQSHSGKDSATVDTPNIEMQHASTSPVLSTS